MPATAATAGISAGCRRCGAPISTHAKPGNTIRCPSCGYAQRFRPPAQAIPLDGSGSATWEPPSEHRASRETTEPCPECSGSLLASPRGTVRACPACRKRVTPPGVLAPYRRGHDTTRTVATQRERDLGAIALAQRKGVMLAQLDALADDPRLDPASLPVVDWFREQVKTATGNGRLDELAALLPEAAIRRRHWWQGTPAAIEAAGYEDDEDQDDEDELHADDAATPAVLATPASIAAQQHRAQPGRPMTWADALAACGWRLSAVIGGCQVIDRGQLCGTGTAHHVATTAGISGWVCTRHHAALCEVLTEHNRRAGL
jgi:uncharacterized Zn finger protein (UPF0148 family)